MDLWINIGPNALSSLSIERDQVSSQLLLVSLSALLLFFYQYNYFIDLLRYLKIQTNKERYEMT